MVGNGFVFVRGLGDRYSLALLNGSPLPSPEPLRRVVPLDIFPTSVIASSLVQKSYSVNYPGEFGGGVINLTTPAVPRETFLDVGASVSVDTETSFQLGYTYYGSDLDWLGFDDGTRDFPPALRDGDGDRHLQRRPPPRSAAISPPAWSTRRPPCSSGMQRHARPISPARSAAAPRSTSAAAGSA